MIGDDRVLPVQYLALPVMFLSLKALYIAICRACTDESTRPHSNNTSAQARFSNNTLNKSPVVVVVSCQAKVERKVEVVRSVAG